MANIDLSSVPTGLISNHKQNDLKLFAFAWAVDLCEPQKKQLLVEDGHNLYNGSSKSL